MAIEYATTYSTLGTYYISIPNGVVGLKFTCRGSGGCGGARTTALYGGGGKGGGYSFWKRGLVDGVMGTGLPTNVVLGGIITIVVPAGGTSAGTNNGAIASVSLPGFGSPVCIATGGAGVAVNIKDKATTDVGSAVGDTTYFGGTGTTGSAGNGGGGGGGEGGCSTGTGNNASNTTGGSGCDGGDGGNGRTTVSLQGPGVAGTRPGGGGGGAYSTSASYVGGAGGDGTVDVSYYVENAVYSIIFDEFL